MSHLTLSGVPCGLPDGHKRSHLTIPAASRHRERIRQWALDHRQHKSATTKAWTHTKSGRINKMLAGARVRSKESGQAFTLCRKDIEDVWLDECVYCGCAWGEPKGKQAPSLDRIIPFLGYIPGNVSVACRGCNTRKQDMTPGEMRKLADAVEAELERQRTLAHIV